MTNQEAIEMLTAKAECIRREASGIDVDCNHRNCDECDLCYKQGTMGDQMEALGVAISALQEQEAKRLIESSLTQKPLDTISRTTAIDALKGLPTWWADEGGYYGGAQPPMVALLDPEDAVSAIENLPSAQPEPPWIPVSERLPKDGTEVFVYLFNLPSPFIAWIEDTRWYTEDFEVERENEPIAWMPLPDPYRAERRTDNANIDT